MGEIEDEEVRLIREKFKNEWISDEQISVKLEKVKKGELEGAPKLDTPEIKVDLDDPEVRIKLAKQKTFDNLKKKMKDQFPKVHVKETFEGIESIRKNHKCMTCRFYVSQSSIPEVKERINSSGSVNMENFRIRLYRNKAELLEDTRGICAIPISMGRHIKTVINRPDLSLCSDYILHHDIVTYITALQERLLEEQREEEERIAEIERENKRLEEAKRIIEEIEKKRIKNNTKKPRGRPSKNPDKKTYIPPPEIQD